MHVGVACYSPSVTSATSTITSECASVAKPLEVDNWQFYYAFDPGFPKKLKEGNWRRQAGVRAERRGWEEEEEVVKGVGVVATLHKLRRQQFKVTSWIS